MCPLRDSSRHSFPGDVHLRNAILLAATALVPLTAVSAQPLEQVPLIERSKIFGNPVKAQGRISPDGKWLSWTAPRDGVMNVWVAPADNADAAKPLTNEKTRPVRQYF